METKICDTCQQPKPLTNFPKYASNKRKLVSGEERQYSYRKLTCRSCVRAANKKTGKCFCGLPSEKGSCERCRSAMRESAATRRQIDREQALQHYGSSCVYCGETLSVFLTIDHIHNDGAKHRQHVRRNGKIQSGFDIGAWLRKNKYPSGFQILCVNCNHAKFRIGEESLKQILKDAGRLIAAISSATDNSKDTPGVTRDVEVQLSTVSEID